MLYYVHEKQTKKESYYFYTAQLIHTSISYNYGQCVERAKGSFPVKEQELASNPYIKGGFLHYYV